MSDVIVVPDGKIRDYIGGKLRSDTPKGRRLKPTDVLPLLNKLSLTHGTSTPTPATEK